MEFLCLYCLYSPIHQNNSHFQDQKYDHTKSSFFYPHSFTQQYSNRAFYSWSKAFVLSFLNKTIWLTFYYLNTFSTCPVKKYIFVLKKIYFFSVRLKKWTGLLFLMPQTLIKAGTLYGTKVSACHSYSYSSQVTPKYPWFGRTSTSPVKVAREGDDTSTYH